MSEAAAISITGVSMRYEDGPLVIEGVGLDLAAGRFQSVIGPSGCGKSTLLRLVAGLLMPGSGSVLVAGRDPCHERGRGTGFVFQEPTLMPWLTVRDNIALSLRIRGVEERERGQRAAALAEGLGLGDYLGYYPRQLSGGMKMRVSLARALSTAPGLMLFDEPFAGLDSIRRDHMGEELLGVWAREGWTALFVTHNVAEAAFLSERVHIMGGRPGRIVARYEVPFPYPRTAALRATPEFHDLVARISAGLGEVSAL
ncbi:MAG: ABC transporter ATP-binding protein [Opitutales bacterium]|jgi:NitT/TauT family transport system ATP-binding protein